ADLWQHGVLAAAPPAVDRLRTPDEFARPPWLEPRAAKLQAEVAEAPGAWKRASGPRSWAESVHRLFTRVPAIGLFDDLRRLGRASGVDLRAPLFDLDVVEVALRLDPALSFGGTLSKPVLRGALAGELPDAVRLRPLKTRFDEILIAGVRGPDRPHIERLLGDPRAELRLYVRPDALRELLDREPRRGT